MSWTDTFPFLTDGMLGAFQEHATHGERAQLDQWLGIDRVFNPQEGPHLVVTSLYRDPARTQHDDFDVVAKKKLPAAEATVSWSGFHRLLEAAAVIRMQKKDLVLRVYLSADLADLVDELVKAGCEVVLMRGSCFSNNPASMWRFLALEEEGRWITITHGNFGGEIIHDVERTEQLMTTLLAGWRMPHLVGDRSQRLEARSYRPIYFARFGAKGGFPTGLLMRALIWHCQRGTIETGCLEGDGSRSYPLEGSEWPSDQFDEWFLLAALYPRLAFAGLLSFFIWERKSVNYWYAVDVEFATWANPASEIFFTHKVITTDSPWKELPESNGVAVRPDTTVFRRPRRKIYETVEDILPRKEVLPFTAFEGSLAALLERAGGDVTTEWWVDASPSLRSFPVGSEFFLDRRYEKADVVVCGHFFFKIGNEVAKWAVDAGLDPASWKSGWIIRIPKLEGPLTLWRTAFCRAFHLSAQEQPDFVCPELLLAAWVQQGKATVMTTTAAKMGWRLG